MNPPSNAMPERPFDSPGAAPAIQSAVRPMYWSVRRELWEIRSIYIAPLAAAAVAILGAFVSLIWLPRSIRTLPALDPARQLVVLATPYTHAAMFLMVTGFLVAIFYCLDALYGERRDRSILFWKSMPVSDLTTVLSKASIPLVVLPLLIFVMILGVYSIMWVMSVAALLVSGTGAAPEWRQLPLFQMEFVQLYILIVLTLWLAPVYCWLLFISGWAKRAPFLWAVLPPLAIGVFETIAFRTSYFGLWVGNRLFGFADGALDLKDSSGAAIDPHFIPLSQLAPGRFLSSAALWLGLIVAAALLAAAVRLRRHREPI